MSLKRVQRTYEQLGREDPLWAVLTRDEFRDNRWDPAEFFATGRTEIREVLHYVDSLELQPPRGRALDFGCGVGRVTQALCDEFSEVVGVDISESMVAKAREFNRCGDRCRYATHTKNDLSLFDSESFDFVYSNKTLQHMPPDCSLGYVREFLRILRVGSVAVFQFPGGPHYEPGSWGAGWYTLRYGVLRPFLKRARGRPAVQMHYVSTPRVRETIESSGGVLVHFVDDTPRRKRRKRMRYCAVKGR